MTNAKRCPLPALNRSNAACELIWDGMARQRHYAHGAGPLAARALSCQADVRWMSSSRWRSVGALEGAVATAIRAVAGLIGAADKGASILVAQQHPLATGEIQIGHHRE